MGGHTFSGRFYVFLFVVFFYSFILFFKLLITGDNSLGYMLGKDLVKLYLSKLPGSPYPPPFFFSPNRDDGQMRKLDLSKAFEGWFRELNTESTKPVTLGC